MFKIGDVTYHIMGLVPAAPGMYAKTTDKRYELVVMWAHVQYHVDSLGPRDRIIGLTLIDIEHGTFAIHPEYTSKVAQDDRTLTIVR